MLPFLQLAHMVDVPQHMGWGGVMLPFWQLAHMVGVPQHMGWGGRCDRSGNLHTWSVFCNTWGGWGDVTVLATCTHGRCSGNLHTWSVFRNTWGGEG